MDYLVISKVKNGRVSRCNVVNDEDAAREIVSRLHNAGRADAFYVQSDIARERKKYLLVDPVNKTVTLDRDKKDHEEGLASWKADIAKLDMGMPRALEDVIDALDDEVKGRINNKTLKKYLDKIDLRKEKPKISD